jgi:hypothetical protein
MRRFLTALAIGILDILSKMGPSTMSCLVVIPSHAKILSAEGWTKKKVKEYIAQHAMPPFPSIVGGTTTPRPPIDVDNLTILVAGGPGAWMGLHRSAGGFGNAFVTKKLELPKNWDKLVAKYRDLKPDYVKY